MNFVWVRNKLCTILSHWDLGACLFQPHNHENYSNLQVLNLGFLGKLTRTGSLFCLPIWWSSDLQSNSWKVLCESQPFPSSSEYFQESFFHWDRPYWHDICTSYQSKSHLPKDRLPYPRPTQFQVCQAWLIPRNPHGWIRETMRLMPLLMRTVGRVSVKIKRKNAKGSCYKMEDLGSHSLHVNSPNNW